ncbi:MAG: threonine synthase [Bacteriovoracaceae bacterium]|jgi:threonine synthase|nr:threonine synthase [Bacteriovoracaceae bacterium]
MKFKSSRSETDEMVSLSEALSAGLAPDGGLYLPNKIRKINAKEGTLAEVAKQLLQQFFAEDLLKDHLSEICDDTFSFPCVLSEITPELSHLELFHGPSAAFKDYGARFLARCYSYLEQERVILVATSGDTGGAVAAAFDGVKNTKVVILYPKDGVSPLQEHQLTCWSDNILSLRVAGTFDDCQKLVKEAFVDCKFKSEYRLTSANSINIGRLMPQMTYYAHSSLQYFNEKNSRPNYIIPTGNMGNAIACFWAKAEGLPIGDIYLVTNANDAIPKALESGKLVAKPSVKTLANAMDVAFPSNFERYESLQSGTENYQTKSYSVSDEEIKEAMKAAYGDHHLSLCPHTATAYHIWKKEKIRNAIIVGTAHPAKFQEVSDSIGIKTQLPISLEKILKKEVSVKDIPASFEALKKYVIDFC